MEAGSGAGTAAGQKAGWLPRPLRGSIGGSQNPLPALIRLAIAAASPPPAAPARSRPAIGPDGRPLPPDGSSPPPRPQTGAIPAASRPVSRRAPINPPAGADGRPLPPVGAAPRRRPAVSGQPRSQSVPQPAPRVSNSARIPGSRLPPGQGPVAPAGHTYVSRPAAAPAGEFLFEIRCSCGRSSSAAVTLTGLKQAAARGVPAAETIATATQDALDAMHSVRA